MSPDPTTGDPSTEQLGPPPALIGALPPQHALTQWAGTLQSETDTLFARLAERSAATRAIRTLHAASLAAATESVDVCRLALEMAALPLSQARLATLHAAVQRTPDEDRNAAVRTWARESHGVPDRPSGGRVLTSALLIVAGLLGAALHWPSGNPLVPGTVSVLLILAGAVLAALLVLGARGAQRGQRAHRDAVRHVAAEGLALAETARQQTEAQLQDMLSGVGGAADITTAVRRLDRWAELLRGQLARENPARIGVVHLAGDAGERVPPAGVDASARVMEAAAASRAIWNLPFPIDLQPGKVNSVLLLSDEDAACQTILRLAPHALSGYLTPLYRIEYSAASSYARNLETLGMDTRPTATSVGDISNMLVELSIQVRRAKREGQQLPGLLVIFGLPVVLSPEERSALFDLLLEGPLTGMSVLAAISPQLLARNRRWNELEGPALLLRPPEDWPEDAGILSPGQWFVPLAHRALPVTLAVQQDASDEIARSSA